MNSRIVLVGYRPEELDHELRSLPQIEFLPLSQALRDDFDAQNIKAVLVPARFGATIVNRLKAIFDEKPNPVIPIGTEGPNGWFRGQEWLAPRKPKSNAALRSPREKRPSSPDAPGQHPEKIKIAGIAPSLPLPKPSPSPLPPPPDMDVVTFVKAEGDLKAPSLKAEIRRLTNLSRARYGSRGFNFRLILWAYKDLKAQSPDLVEPKRKVRTLTAVSLYKMVGNLVDVRAPLVEETNRLIPLLLSMTGKRMKYGTVCNYVSRFRTIARLKDSGRL